MCEHLDIDHLNTQTIDLSGVLEAIDETIDTLQDATGETEGTDAAES